MRVEVEALSKLISPVVHQHLDNKNGAALNMLEERNAPLPMYSKRYKAMFRWITPKDKDEFRDSKVIVPISIGQKYHEEGEFEATLKLIDESFKTCTILIGDTLKRHSITLNEQSQDENTLLALSRMAGDAWFIRNEKYISKLSIPCTISRWDDWRHRQDYFYYANLVSQLYREDSLYKNIVHGLIENFLTRAGRQNNKNDEMFSCSLNYILEESAVICLWIKDGFKFNVYPSGDNKAMMYAYEKCAKNDGAYRSLALNIERLAMQSI